MHIPLSLPMRQVFTLAIVAVLLSVGCKKDRDGDDPQPTGNCGGNGEVCDNSYLPILMLHGTLASGDTYA